MTLLITGANSFFGRALCTHALKDGVAFTALTRAEADLGTDDGLEKFKRAVPGHDMIIHVAHPNQTPHAAADAMRAMVEARDLNTKIIFISSVAVYGPKDFGTPIAEDSACAPITENGRSKLLCEQVLTETLSENDFLILRLPQITGTGVRQYTPGTLAQKLAVDDAITLYHQGRVGLDFVDVRDTTRTVFDLIARRAHGIYNLGSGNTILLYDFVQALKQSLHSQSTVTLLDEPRGVDWAVMDCKKIATHHAITLPMDLARVVSDIAKGFTHG